MSMAEGQSIKQLKGQSQIRNFVVPKWYDLTLKAEHLNPVGQRQAPGLVECPPRSSSDSVVVDEGVEGCEDGEGVDAGEVGPVVHFTISDYVCYLGSSYPYALLCNNKSK